MTSPYFCQVMSMSVLGKRSALINNISTCSHLADWYLHHWKVQIIQVYPDHYNSQRILCHLSSQNHIRILNIPNNTNIQLL